MFMKTLIKKQLARLGYKLERIEGERYADMKQLEKASKFIERYREIVSDPVNLLINRVPEAGYIDSEGCVILHNGNKVPFSGKYSYYDNFSEVLVINRGVHEPLEEYCFQETIARINNGSPIMLELGSYWAHYSMWMLKKHPDARCFMVEPEKTAIDCGKKNFSINHYRGEFINEFVARGKFEVDGFLLSRNIDKLDVLHTDIQGYELEMLDGASSAFSDNKIDYVFISTHSEELHNNVKEFLSHYNYRIEVSSAFDTHTTSCDGFVLASSNKVERVFGKFKPLGRIDIAKATPSELLNSLIESSNVDLHNSDESCAT